MVFTFPRLQRLRQRLHHNSSTFRWDFPRLQRLQRLQTAKEFLIFL